MLDVCREIKSLINLAEYARSSGVEVVKRGSLFFCSSPFNEDRDPSCALYPDHFHDFSSGEHGDIFDFIQAIDGVDFVEALNRAAGYCGVKIDETHRERAREMQEARDKLERSLQLSLEKRNDEFWKWIEGRGISKEVADVFSLGFHPQHRAITIPCFGFNGKVVSITLRRIDGEPKYQHFNTPFFERKSHLFNLPRILDIAEGDKPIYVVEGQMDVMALWQAGFRTAVATYGETMTVGQARLLGEKLPNSTVVIIPDNDEANQEHHRRQLLANISTIKGNANCSDVRVARLRAHDPNDELLEHGVEVLSEDVASHVSADKYIMEDALSRAGTIEAEYDIARKVVGGIKNQMVVEDIADMLAERWNKDRNTVRTYLQCPRSTDKSGNIRRVEQAIEAYEQFADSLANPVFRFPWPSFNDKIRAIAPGHIMAFIARTSVGKTMWMLNLIDHCCRTRPDAHIMFFTLEQPDVEIASRLLAIRSASLEDPDRKVSTREVEAICRMREEEDEWEWRKKDFVETYRNLSLVEDILDVDGIEATINEGSMAYGPVKIVFLDYLGLIDGRGEEYEHISYVAKELKNIAKRTGVVMVYLHQISRKGEDGSKPVTLDQARGSGVIEESLDYLIGAWRPSGTNSPEFKAAILKNRHGPLGDTDLYIDTRTLSITEVEHRIDDGEAYGDLEERAYLYRHSYDESVVEANREIVTEGDVFRQAQMGMDDDGELDPFA